MRNINSPSHTFLLNIYYYFTFLHGATEVQIKMLGLFTFLLCCKMFE